MSLSSCLHLKRTPQHFVPLQVLEGKLYIYSICLGLCALDADLCKNRTTLVEKEVKYCIGLACKVFAICFC